MIESIHPEEGRLAIALFDRDNEGINAFDRLSRNFVKMKDLGDIKEHKHKMAYASLLPIPPERYDYAIQKNLPMEFLFCDEVLNKRSTRNLGLILVDPKIDSLIVDGRKLDTNQLNLPLTPVLDQLIGLNKIQGGKNIFAQEIVPTLELSKFDNFVVVFDLILYIIEESKKQHPGN